MVAQYEGGAFVEFYGNYVRLCSERGMSPSAAALAIGLDKSAASRWARGAVPRYQTLIGIAGYFGVTIAELVGATKENEKEIAKELRISVYVLNESHETSAEKSDEGAVQQKGTGLAAALEALRDQPGRRMLLAATSGMTEEQVERMASWIAELRGGSR